MGNPIQINDKPWEWAANLGLTGPQQVRDLWRQQDLTVTKGEHRAEVPGHGCVLLRIGGKQAP